MGGNPWSVPRLRGRGDQGNTVIQNTSRSVLYVATFSYRHEKASPPMRVTTSSALLTTASQARHAPRLPSAFSFAADSAILAPS